MSTRLSDRWTEADLIHAMLQQGRGRVSAPPPAPVVIGDNAWSLILPWPPSFNDYYVPVARGVLRISRAGRAWRDHVCLVVNQSRQNRPPLTGRLRVRIEFHAPDTIRDRDSDNFCGKHILDSLERARVCSNDSQFDEVYYRRGSIATPPYLAVLVDHCR